MEEHEILKITPPNKMNWCFTGKPTKKCSKPQCKTRQKQNKNPFKLQACHCYCHRKYGAKDLPWWIQYQLYRNSFPINVHVSESAVWLVSALKCCGISLDWPAALQQEWTADSYIFTQLSSRWPLPFSAPVDQNRFSERESRQCCSRGEQRQNTQVNRKPSKSNPFKIRFLI